MECKYCGKWYFPLEDYCTGFCSLGHKIAYDEQELLANTGE